MLRSGVYPDRRFLPTTYCLLTTVSNLYLFVEPCFLLLVHVFAAVPSVTFEYRQAS